MLKLILDNKGQGTVELAIVFPVIIIIAVIAVNALTFFSQCSSFDRTFKQTVTNVGSSPAYGTDISYTKTLLERKLDEDFKNDFIDFEINVSGVRGGLQEFNGILKMSPTLFGMGLRSEIFGVPLPLLTHEQKIVIEVYKPGVLF